MDVPSYPGRAQRSALLTCRIKEFLFFPFFENYSSTVQKLSIFFSDYVNNKYCILFLKIKQPKKSARKIKITMRSHQAELSTTNNFRDHRFIHHYMYLHIYTYMCTCN